jgi:hypothetical protein
MTTLNLGVMLTPLEDAGIRKKLQPHLDRLGEMPLFRLDEVLQDYTEPAIHLHVNVFLVDYTPLSASLWHSVPVTHDLAPSEAALADRLLGKSPDPFGRRVPWPSVRRALREELGTEVEIRVNLAHGKNEVTLSCLSRKTAIQGSPPQAAAA